jgi:outer membrane lipoprotein-sorting protein
VLTLRRALLALCTLCWLCLPARAEDAPRALDALLAKLAKVDGLSAHFREEKRLSLVAVPLVSEGMLYYQKPRLLARHTLTPAKSSVLLEGDLVRFSDGTRSESMGLDSQPALRLLVDTIVSVLAGDKAALGRLAQPSYEARGQDGWRIKVVPKDPKLLRIVRALSFEGKGAELTNMELVDGHGDVTATTFSQVRFGRLPAAEAKRVFRVEGGG